MIPVRNLFAMLAFCWRDVELLNGAALGACEFEKHYEVAARLLDVAIRRMFRRGLELGYQVIEESGPRPRGALDLSRTTRELLTARGELAFRVDELLEDTPANRLIKAACAVLIRTEDLDLEVRRRLSSHFARLSGVSLLRPEEALRLKVYVPRNENANKEAIWLSQLTLSALLPDEGAFGKGRQHVLRVEDRLPTLFEGFIRGAAKHFLNASGKVSAPKLQFSVAQCGPEALALVPEMRTDVVISWNDHQRSLLECKFYETPLARAARSNNSEAERFRIGHLYQILTYANVMARSGSKPSVTIIYGAPSVGARFDEQFSFEGVDLRVAWVDLSAPWSLLRTQIIDLVSWRGLTSGSRDTDK